MISSKKRRALQVIHFFRPVYVPLCNWIRKKFKDTSVVFVTLKFFRRISNPVFRNYISKYRNPKEGKALSAINNQVIYMPVHVLGNKNKGKIIMLLENQTYHAGFCSTWMYFLNRLSFSDKMGFYHVIDWNQSDFYQENHPINGSESIFEYYFQQPSGISLEEAYESMSVVYDGNISDFGYNDVFHVGGNMDYCISENDIDRFAEIQKKYIHLKSDIEKSFSIQIKELFQGKEIILGVHARGADTKIGYKNHPTIVTSEDYIDKTEEIAKEINAELIFLATDDQTMLEQFKAKFGEKLVYYDDVIRSNSTVMNCFIEKDRENHHYLLGLEIVRDVYTLAACQGFVCGMSYVSLIVQILKRAQNQKFRAFHRIFKGLTKDGVELTDPHARRKIRDQWNKELNQGNKEEMKNEKDKRA